MHCSKITIKITAIQANASRICQCENEKNRNGGQRQTVDPLGDLEKAIRRLPVEEPSEQRHLMALFLP